MKIKNFLMLAVFTLFVFTACQDNKKKDSMENGMEKDNTEMNDLTNDGMDEEAQAEVEKTDTKTVADVIEGGEKYGTLLAAMKEAGVIVELDGTDQYTVFAPTNSAFEELPSGTIEKWMEPKNSEELEGVLSYHIVPGNVDKAKLIDLIEKSDKGEYVLVTANDGKLKATINKAGNVILTDAAGGEATVVAVDNTASNGVVHSINSVLMRK